eukprot:g170.t1
MQRTVLSASPSSFGARFERNTKPMSTFSPSSYEEFSSRRSSLDFGGNNAVSSGSGNRPAPVLEEATRAKTTAPIPTVGFAKPPLKESNRRVVSQEQSNNLLPVRAPAPGLLSLTLERTNQASTQQSEERETKLAQQFLVDVVDTPWSLGKLQKLNPVFSSPVVIQAYSLASKAHQGQYRKNGDPVLVHCVETAKILSELDADEHIIAAALLHDVVDDTCLSFNKLAPLVPADVFDLIKKVSKLSYTSQLARNSAKHDQTKLKDVLIASVDCRAVLIKLADRIHNLRTLDALSVDKQRLWAQETMDLFIPLAGRLGCWSLKSEMEDLCFSVLHPEAHEVLLTEYNRKLASFSESKLQGVLNQLKSALDERGVRYEDLSGRPKNLYGVYQKMKKKEYEDIDQVLDLFALRIILKDDQDCYEAQQIVHGLWKHLPERSKDYISCPKTNGYRSLHDVCLLEDGVIPLEVQIRTMKMHYIAEHGVAAHWRYKEDHEEHPMSEFVELRTLWSRYVLNWVFELNDMKLRPDSHPTDDTSTQLNTIWNAFWSFERKDLGFIGCKHGAKINPNWCPVYVLVQDEQSLQICETPIDSSLEEFLLEHVGILKNTKMLPLVNGERLEPHSKLQFGDLIEFSNNMEDEEDSRGTAAASYSLHHLMDSSSSSSSMGKLTNLHSQGDNNLNGENGELVSSVIPLRRKLNS